MLIWFLVIKLSGYELGIIAWGVGVLAGVGARTLGRAGSTWLGVAAALCAVVGIVGGQYLALRSELNKDNQEGAVLAYNERMDEAKKGAGLQTDEEIKAYLVNQSEDEKVSADQIKNFKEKEQPKLKDFLNGKPTRDEFIKEQVKEVSGLEGSLLGNSLLLFFSFFHLFTLLWLFIGVSSAFRIASR